MIIPLLDVLSSQSDSATVLEHGSQSQETNQNIVAEEMMNIHYSATEYVCIERVKELERSYSNYDLPPNMQYTERVFIFLLCFSC